MRDWRITLVEAHPQLFHALPGKAAASRAYPKCGDGWHGLLECACERIETALADGDRFVAREISQKLGSLRFYWSGKLRTSSQPLVTDAVCRAEARSHCTCDVCGEPGRLYRAELLMTRCIVHASGVPVPIEPGFENAHLVQQARNGRSKVIACRYDRATDAFVEIRSASCCKDEMPGRRFGGSKASSGGIDWLRCGSRHRQLWVSHRREHSPARRHLHDRRAPALRQD